jgi:hypothetical protein
LADILLTIVSDQLQQVGAFAALILTVCTKKDVCQPGWLPTVFISSRTYHFGEGWRLSAKNTLGYIDHHILSTKKIAIVRNLRLEPPSVSWAAADLGCSVGLSLLAIGMHTCLKRDVGVSLIPAPFMLEPLAGALSPSSLTTT